MEKTRNHVNLTDKETSFCHTLVVHEKEINSLYEKNNLNELKNYIQKIVLAVNDKPLEKKSVATKRFLISLQKQRSCSGVIQLVWNARLKGDNLGVL